MVETSRWYMAMRITATANGNRNWLLQSAPLKRILFLSRPMKATKCAYQYIVFRHIWPNIRKNTPISPQTFHNSDASRLDSKQPASVQCKQHSVCSVSFCLHTWKTYDGNQSGDIQISKYIFEHGENDMRMLNWGKFTVKCHVYCVSTLSSPTTNVMDT